MGLREKRYGPLSTMVVVAESILGLAPGADCLDDLGAETRERQKAADLCWFEALLAARVLRETTSPAISCCIHL
jgi:hypothetical protein